MKKILIFYGSYGGGHLSAARSIKEYINLNYKDYQIEMVDCIEYINKALNKVTTKAYSDMAKNAHWIWKKVYYSADYKDAEKIGFRDDYIFKFLKNGCKDKEILELQEISKENIVKLYNQYDKADKTLY